jgi:uracil-DNA glycosylase
MEKIEMHESWKQVLFSEFSAPYFKNIQSFLIEEKQKHKIYPKDEKIFAAFNYCLFENTKVVILGQDPYHGDHQANGLAFSVSNGIKIPPSLKNVFKELNADLGIIPPTNGNLESWSKQGVLLLNATLTVRANQAGSHQKIGWETFTNKVIEILSQKKENLVFLLWGNFAHSKEKFIDTEKHLVLKAAHPSPLARGGFFGSKPFSQTNEFLRKNKIEEINWNSINSESELINLFYSQHENTLDSFHK